MISNCGVQEMPLYSRKEEEEWWHGSDVIHWGLAVGSVTFTTQDSNVWQTYNVFYYLKMPSVCDKVMMKDITYVECFIFLYLKTTYAIDKAER